MDEDHARRERGRMNSIANVTRIPLRGAGSDGAGRLNCERGLGVVLIVMVGSRT